MKYLYTDQPDESCHEVAPGVYGRPVHTYEQSKLRAKGWKSNVGEFEAKEEASKEDSKAEAVLTDELQELQQLYELTFGKKPHHKTKAETLRAKLGECGTATTHEAESH